MLEVVRNFINTNDYNEARKLQNNILLFYELNFAKNAPVNEVQYIRDILKSFPLQLAKENKKFIYGMIKKSAADFKAQTLILLYK